MRKRPIIALAVVLLFSLVCAACGSTTSSTADGLFDGTSVDVSLQINSPGANADSSSGKGLGSGNVSKSVTVSPDSCTITVTASDMTTVTKTFSFSSSVTVALTGVTVGNNRTFAVDCTDSTQTVNSNTSGYKGSTTTNIASGATTLSLTPKFKNIGTNGSASSGDLESVVVSQTGGFTNFVLHFSGTLTNTQKANTRCIIEFDSDAGSETRTAISTSGSTCLTSGTPGDVYINVVGGIRKGTCFVNNTSKAQTVRGREASWSTANSGANQTLTCTVSTSHFTGNIDSDESGYMAVACRTATTGNCTAIPSSGFMQLDVNQNTNTTFSQAANGASCTVGNNGGDCSSGWCITVDTATGALCTPLAADSNGDSPTTIGGSSGSSGTTNGNLASSRFTLPNDVWLTNDGNNLFIADTGTHTITRIDLSVATSNASYKTLCCGQASTSGASNGTCNPVSGGTFSSPVAIVGNSSDDTFYVVETGNHNVRQFSYASNACSALTTLAGNGSAGSANGVGSSASFDTPRGIAINSQDTALYIADTGNHTVRKIVIASADVTTPYGSAGNAGATDASGSSARFSTPRYLAIDSTDTFLYVADQGNANVRRINLATDDVVTFNLSSNPFSTITAIAIDPTGTLIYVVNQSAFDRIFSINIANAIDSSATPSSVITAGNALNNPIGIKLNHRGTLFYIADTGNHIILTSE